jgi:outer membrane lipoprotein-sorting protein
MGSTTMLLGALALQGMLPPPPSFYVEPPPGAAPGRVRVWVDKEQGLVLKRTVIETARHLSQTATSPDGMAVELQLTDTFTVARTGNAVSEDLFRFQPPEGSKQRVR